MKVFHIFSLLLAVASTTAARMYSEEESQKIIREELQNMAYNYKSNLRLELSSLESEMYDEFLSFMEEVRLSQISFSEVVRANLSMNTDFVLEKFGKVMVYSTYKRENLNKLLGGVLDLLGAHTDDVISNLVFNYEEIMPKSLLNSESGRSRRRILDSFDPEVIGGSFPHLEMLQNLDYENIFGLPEKEDNDYLDDEGHYDLLNHLDLVDEGRMSEKVLEDKTSEKVRVRGSDELPRDCLDLLLSGHTEDGIYTIYISGVGVDVWCDQGSEGGGWTVVVGRRGRRPSLSFKRPPSHYVHGFGHPHLQHWIGLEHMTALTWDMNSSLLVQLTDQHQTPTYALYHSFRVSDGESGYKLSVGDYDNVTSTTIDALTQHSGTSFTFPARSTDADACAVELGVGWWFISAPTCYHALPTGHLGQEGRGGLSWGDGQPPYSLFMMLRRNVV